MLREFSLSCHSHQPLDYHLHVDVGCWSSETSLCSSVSNHPLSPLFRGLPMATTLCCTTKERSISPDTLAPQPLFVGGTARHSHSARNIKLARPDELQLNSIIVTATLPEDHPHAVKFTGRKVPLDRTIVRSPSLGNKLRTQLSRKSLVPSKSLQSLRHPIPRFMHRKPKSKTSTGNLSFEDILYDKTAADGGYDSDAHSMKVPSRLMSAERAPGISVPLQESLSPSAAWLTGPPGPESCALRTKE